MQDAISLEIADNPEVGARPQGTDRDIEAARHRRLRRADAAGVRADAVAGVEPAGGEHRSGLPVRSASACTTHQMPKTPGPKATAPNAAPVVRVRNFSVGQSTTVSCLGFGFSSDDDGSLAVALTRRKSGAMPRLACVVLDEYLPQQVRVPWSCSGLGLVPRSPFVLQDKVSPNGQLCSCPHTLKNVLDAGGSFCARQGTASIKAAIAKMHCAT